MFQGFRGATLGGALALAALLTSCGTTVNAPPSDHFDGRVFFNPGVTKESSVTGYLRLRLTQSQPDWPASVPVEPFDPPPARVAGPEARVTMIGHATLLIQTQGLNILTDPVFSERASPFSFAGPKRITPPALSVAQLPPIDLVLISHNHFDHLDLPSLRALDAAFRPRVLVPLGNRARVAEAMPASRVSEHDWGEVVALDRGMRVFVEPMQHGSGRSPFDQMQSLWAAYLIDSGATRLYFAGDTGYGDGRNFKAARAKFDPIDLAILPIGAYEPQWFMADSHMQPSDAVRAWRDTGARRALAHHHDIFQLGFEAYGAAEAELKSAVAQAGLAAEGFVTLKPGQFLRVTPSSGAATSGADARRTP